MLKDVGELISLTVNQDRNHHIVNGRILFHRIETPSTSDPLSGELTHPPTHPLSTPFISFNDFSCKMISFFE